MIRLGRDIDRLRIRRPTRRREPVREVTHECDWPGCEAKGPHRAPKSPERLRDYYWFCLDHAREYNAAWNFFEGMSDSQVEAYIKNNVTGHRPTWAVGSNSYGRTAEERRSRSEHPWEAYSRGVFGSFDDGPGDGRADYHDAGQARKRRRRLPASVSRALAILDLDAEASLQDIKRRYKELVKRYHPDANGGDRTAEERLRQVIQAYSHLKACGYH